MQFRGKQIPAWVLLLVILGAAAAAVAVGSSGATVLTGDTQIAVANKLKLENVTLSTNSDPPAKYTGVVHLANDRESYMVNFIADEGDTIVIKIDVTNMAGINTVVAIKTDAPEYFDVGYSTTTNSGVLGDVLRKIDGEWVLYMDAGATETVYQIIWIKTKPPCPAGQYTIMTWIEQKFQS